MRWISADRPPFGADSLLTIILYRPTGFAVGISIYPAYPGSFNAINGKWYLLGDNEPVEGVTHYQHLSSLLWHNEGWEPVD